MRKAVVFFFGAVMLTAFGGTALADAGGTPNSNAFTPAGANGRKAECPPPGSVFKQYAQMPGSNSDPGGLGMTPGQEVVFVCGVGPS